MQPEGNYKDTTSALVVQVCFIYYYYKKMLINTVLPMGLNAYVYNEQGDSDLLNLAPLLARMQ